MEKFINQHYKSWRLIMPENKQENNIELPKSQQELFRSLMIKEKLNKIQQKLLESTDETTIKTIRNYAYDSQILKALKMMKDKK